MPGIEWDKEIPCPDPDALDDEPLDEASAKKALEELHEDPKERLGQIKTLRSWLKTQPHLIFPSDNRFLLQFLRGAKFSQLRARKMIESYLKLLSEYADWFKEVDTTDPQIHKVLDKGAYLPLPFHDDNGCAILMQRVGAIEPDTKDFTVDDEMRAGMAVWYHMVTKAKVQVNGIVFIIDFKGASMKHLLRYSSDKMMKVNKDMEGALPGRFKAFHYCNTGPVFEAFFNLFKTVLWRKILQRTEVHGSDMKKMYKSVPLRCLPDEYLPDDYDGPSAGTIDTITRRLKKKLQEPEVSKWVAYATQPKWRIDESKRVKDDQPQASFRKLTTD